MIAEMLRRSLETTGGISCGAHIDDDGAIVELLQTQRPDCCIPLLCDTVRH
jgi:hypothetical protein